jgi:hypothetical protein
MTTLYNKKGMMLFPNPLRRTKFCKSDNVIVVQHCYCPNGHNLISSKAVFNGFNGIIVKVKDDKKNLEGLVALSPVYGYKSRVSLDVDLGQDTIWPMYCPECNEALATYTDCNCGGQMVVMFLDNKKDFENCIGVCNRIGCENAGITYGNELLTSSGLEVSP